MIRDGQALLTELETHPAGDHAQERISDMQASLGIAKQAKAKIQDKLDRLLAFDASSPRIFEGLDQLAASLKAMSQLTQAVWNPQTKTFASVDLRGLDLMNSSQIQELTRDVLFVLRYDVHRPEGMSDAEFKEYVRTLRTQVRTLESDGWTKKAIKDGYIDTVNAAYDPNKEMSIAAQLGECFNNAHIVGSALFNKMMTVAYKDTQEGQEKTLDMIYKVLGAKVDENGFLQMTNMKITDSDQQGAYKFTTNMDDALDFDNTFSGIVQGAYPKGLPTNLKEGSQDFTRAQETHQFRYYMDKKNNDALRAAYPDEKNDLERIKRYNKDHPSGKFTGEKARLHNKYQGERKDYKDHIEKYGENSKYVSSDDGFHTEFVVDKNGNLVTQWNAYEIDENGNVNSDPNKQYTKEEQMQLVDGNSVNYAENSDGYHD